MKSLATQILLNLEGHSYSKKMENTFYLSFQVVKYLGFSLQRMANLKMIKDMIKVYLEYKKSVLDPL